MDPARWKQIKTLLDRALTLPADERSAFLSEACAGDEVLRQEIQTLLDVQSADARFLETPPGKIVELLRNDTTSVMSGRRLGVYDLHERIGMGGMGEVYRARDTRLGRDVAVKILPRAFTGDPDRIARFEREARLLASLNHPNIATIHGVEDEDGVRAIVMELIRGETLAESIRGGPLSLEDVVAIGGEIADALDAAHAQGIVHRDLKPANIKITPGGAVKVLDFGLATVSGDLGTQILSLAPTITMSGTRDGVILGTVAYMSPEQARGQRVDARSDVWSFGCILYEALTGRAAFARGTISDTFAAVLEREPDWNALPRDAPLALRGLMLRCLEKDPQRRFQNIADVRAELRTAKLALNQPRTGWHRVSEFTRMSFMIAVLLLVALTAGIALRVFSGTTPSSPGSAAAISSIAVLPLVNLGERKENEYLADGLALNVMNSLAKQPGLNVVSRSSAFAFKGQNRDVREIARALNVSTIVEGTLQQAGTTLRVSVQLTDGANGFQLWTETFERDVANIAALEGEITQSVLSRIVVGSSSTGKVSIPQPLSASPQAYDLFLRGQYAMAQRTKDGLIMAEGHFREAVKLDPDFGAAWAALAETVIPLHEMHNVRDAEGAYALATDAARRALTVRGRASEGHAALAHILMHQYSWRAAEEEVRLAVKENPGSAISHNWMGWTMQALGRFSEAEQAFRRAISLDPLSGTYHYQLATCLLSLGRPDEAVRVADRGTQLGAEIALAPGVLANVQLGRLEVAQTMLNRSPAGTPPHLVDALRIYVLATAGKRTEARERMTALLDRLPRGDEPGPIMVPFAYVALGEPDAAIHWLSESRNVGEFLVEYRLLPEIRALAKYPAMREILRKLDFSEP